MVPYIPQWLLFPFPIAPLPPDHLFYIYPISSLFLHLSLLSSPRKTTILLRGHTDLCQQKISLVSLPDVQPHSLLREFDAQMIPVTNALQELYLNRSLSSILSRNPQLSMSPLLHYGEHRSIQQSPQPEPYSVKVPEVRQAHISMPISASIRSLIWPLRPTRNVRSATRIVRTTMATIPIISILKQKAPCNLMRCLNSSV